MATDQQITLIPLDARPVCYELVKEVAQIANVELALPPKEMLGILKKPADNQALKTWWQKELETHPKSAVIMALDTMTYGGLIAGRVNQDPLESLKNRVDEYFIPLKEENRPRYGFSSILRIPNYNNAEEEPDYWSEHGQDLYAFSENSHQQNYENTRALARKIPNEIMNDFLARRKKNFRLNQIFLSLIDNEQLDFLVYCQDDTGPYGLNVQEALYLEEEIKRHHAEEKTALQTGADEAATLLLAKALWTKSDMPLKVHPLYIPEKGQYVIAKFDGITIGAVVEKQIKTLGAKLCETPEAADLLLIVNAPEERMGDHCEGDLPERDAKNITSLATTLEEWIPKKQVALADVVYANGGDAKTLRYCLNQNIPLGSLMAYAGWNTPGNTIGSALAIAAVETWAKKHQRYNEPAHRNVVLKRLLDDWIYQAEVRPELKSTFQDAAQAEKCLTALMQKHAEELFKKLELSDVGLECHFPCNRFFEIEIILKQGVRC